VRRKANTTEEAEGGAVGVVEGEEVVEVGNFNVLVIEEHVVLVFGHSRV